MNFSSELNQLMSAGVPFIHLISYEEDRVLNTLEEIANARSLGLFSWDLDEQFVTIRAGREAFTPGECTADTVLRAVRGKMPANHLLVLKDFHHCWIRRREVVTRQLRNLVPLMRGKQQFLIFLTPPLPAGEELPRELKNDVQRLEVPLPDLGELESIFREMTAQLRAHPPAQLLRAKIVQSMLGLTVTRARFALATVWAAHQTFDERAIDTITSVKKEAIRESGALEFWAAHEGESAVGGLDLLKDWLTNREAAVTPEARRDRIPFPRGVLLTGIPGTGKSLTAKMLSSKWQMPLLRLDVGAIFTSLLGESEQNIRQAIMLAETISPCILWIDEVEKAFAGIDVRSINAGAPTRVFGSFLTWMQEHKTPVYVVATANEIRGLPPEFYGRFDRTFFLDLPNSSERRAIFCIHLKKAGVSFPEHEYPIQDLVTASQGMVGREIERAVQEALITAYADGKREITKQDLFTALGDTVPISRSHDQIIRELQTWIKEKRAFPASSEDPAAFSPMSGRAMQI